METIPSASYSFTLRVEFPHRAGSLGRILTTVGDTGGLVGAVDIVRMGQQTSCRDITVSARDSEHGQAVVEAVDSTDAMVRQVDHAMLSIGRFQPGDLVVIVAGSPPSTVGSTNLIRVHRLGEEDHA